MKIFKAIILMGVAVLAGAQTPSNADYSLETHIYVQNLAKAGPPEKFGDDGIVFTYSVPQVKIRQRTLEVQGFNMEKNTFSAIGMRLLPRQKLRFTTTDPSEPRLTLPLPLDRRKTYYVTDLTAETFRISLSPGGPPLFFQKAPQTSFIMEVMEDSNPRYIALAFSHEGYQRRHVMARNSQDVYFYVYQPGKDESPGRGEVLDYRFILDGLWTVDPNNPATHRDSQGILVSRLELPRRPQPLINSPIVDKGEVEFVLRDKPGMTVSVVGSFNNWDPFMHPLEEDSRKPGIYRLKLRLPEGRIYYSYMVGAEKINDPLNPKLAAYDDGELCSWVENPRPPREPYRRS